MSRPGVGGSLAAGAALFSACALLLALPDTSRYARARLAAAGLGVTATAWWSRPVVRRAGAGSTVVLAAVATSPWVVLACSCLAVAAVLARRRRVRLGQAERSRAFVLELCPSVAAELRGGQSPGAALAAAVRSCAGEAATTPVVGELLRVPQTADAAAVSGALAQAGAVPGAQGLSRLAVCWSVTGATGSGLATAVDRVGVALRADEGVRRAVHSELAAPRATALLLAALPAGGLVVGTLAGARPLEYLTGAWWGRACLVGGLLLEAVGLWWVDRLAAAAAPRVLT